MYEFSTNALYLTVPLILHAGQRSFFRSASQARQQLESPRELVVNADAKVAPDQLYKN